MNIVRHRSPQNEGLASPSQGDWDPFRWMRDMLRWDPFGDPFREGPFRDMPVARELAVRFDVRDAPKEIVIQADVPGVKEQDLEISVTGNHLTISGKREHEQRTEGETYYAMERSTGSFQRTFTLPENTDPEAVRADVSEGVLTITIPKRTESATKRIQVQSGAGQRQLGTSGQQGTSGQPTGQQASSGQKGTSGEQGTSGQHTGAAQQIGAGQQTGPSQRQAHASSRS